MYQNHYISETTRDQITQVKEYLLSNIIKLCEKEDFNSSIVLDLPQTIGNSLYRISFSPEGLNITMEPETGIYEFSNLYGFNESFTFQGMVISDRGKIVIYKR
jgi:hypothetical protein